MMEEKWDAIKIGAFLFSEICKYKRQLCSFSSAVRGLPYATLYFTRKYLVLQLLLGCKIDKMWDFRAFTTWYDLLNVYPTVFMEYN